MSSLRRTSIQCFSHLQSICLAIATRDMNKDLVCRDSERGRSTFRWFTPHEAAVAEALANIIVPSGEDTPGIEDVGVFGPPAIVALDNLVATSSYRQQLYSRGLLSFNAWALKERRCRFAEMSKEDQIVLLRAAQQVYEGCTEKGSTIRKAWRRLRAIAHMSNGWYYASQLYPQIRDDCFQVFYTNPVSWTWLDYDGPPMDEGYPKLAARR